MASPRSALLAILAAGLLAGVFDYAFVVLFYGSAGTAGYSVQATNTARTIATALPGSKQIATSKSMVTALGLTLHFVIAVGAAGVFYAASRWWRFLVRHWVIGGALFGVGAWLFMQLVVLRHLSALPPQNFPPPLWQPVFAAHIVCVGWPIAWVVSRLGK